MRSSRTLSLFTFMLTLFMWCALLSLTNMSLLWLLLFFAFSTTTDVLVYKPIDNASCKVDEMCQRWCSSYQSMSRESSGTLCVDTTFTTLPPCLSSMSFDWLLLLLLLLLLGFWFLNLLLLLWLLPLLLVVILLLTLIDVPVLLWRVCTLDFRCSALLCLPTRCRFARNVTLFFSLTVEASCPCAVYVIWDLLSWLLQVLLLTLLSLLPLTSMLFVFDNEINVVFTLFMFTYSLVSTCCHCNYYFYRPYFNYFV